MRNIGIVTARSSFQVSRVATRTRGRAEHVIASWEEDEARDCPPASPGIPRRPPHPRVVRGPTQSESQISALRSVHQAAVYRASASASDRPSPLPPSKSKHQCVSSSWPPPSHRPSQQHAFSTQHRRHRRAYYSRRPAMDPRTAPQAKYNSQAQAQAYMMSPDMSHMQPQPANTLHSMPMQDMAAEQNRLQESLKRSVTLVFWYKVREFRPSLPHLLS